MPPVRHSISTDAVRRIAYKGTAFWFFYPAGSTYHCTPTTTSVLEPGLPGLGLPHHRSVRSVHFCGSTTCCCYRLRRKNYYGCRRGIWDHYRLPLSVRGRFIRWGRFPHTVATLPSYGSRTCRLATTLTFCCYVKDHAFVSVVLPRTCHKQSLPRVCVLAHLNAPLPGTTTTTDTTRRTYAAHMTHHHTHLYFYPGSTFFTIPYRTGLQVAETVRVNADSTAATTGYYHLLATTGHRLRCGSPFTIFPGSPHRLWILPPLNILHRLYYAGTASSQNTCWTGFLRLSWDDRPLHTERLLRKRTG